MKKARYVGVRFDPEVRKRLVRFLAGLLNDSHCACGAPVAYVGAVYCGAACAQLAEIDR